MDERYISNSVKSSEESNSFNSIGYSSGLPENAQVGARPRLHSMKLDMAASCNIACDYCYVERGASLPGPRRMSKGTVEQAIAWFAQETRKTDTVGDVVLFGGEPLMNPEGVLAATSAIQTINAGGERRMTLQMITNATMITDDVAIELAKAKATVMVSVDGPSDIHDKHRVDSRGRGTYDSVIYGLGVLRKYLPEERIWARGTTNGEVKQVDVFNHLIDLGFRKINIGFVDDVLPSFMSDNQYRYEIDQLMERYVELVLNGHNVDFHPMNTYLTLVYNSKGRGKSRVQQDCGAGTRLITVASNGDFYPCDLAASMHNTIDWSMGNVWSGMNVDKLNDFLGQTNSIHDHCHSCWANSLCDKGCKVKTHLNDKHSKCHADGHHLQTVWRAAVDWYEILEKESPGVLLKTVDPGAHRKIREASGLHA